MADHKKHHFIPRFYLRYFSYLNNKKQIGVALPDKCISYPKGTISDEGQLPYFYGRDGEIEDKFIELETEASRILGNIISSKTLPKVNTEDYKFLSFYTIMSIERTQLAAEVVMGTSNYLRDNILEANGNDKMLGYDKPFDSEVAIKMKLGIAVEVSNILDDLKVKLLVNNTRMPFITSDNPIVKYNQLAEKHNFLMGAYGFASMGIQLFFPISPMLMLIFYDGQAYKFGNKKDLVIESNLLSDIQQLNFLQFLKCNEKVFYNHQCEIEDINRLHFLLKKFPRKAHSINKEVDYVNEKGEVKKDTMFMVSQVETRITLNLSFIKDISSKLKVSRFKHNMRKSYWRR